MSLSVGAGSHFIYGAYILAVSEPTPVVETVLLVFMLGSALAQTLYGESPMITMRANLVARGTVLWIRDHVIWKTNATDSDRMLLARIDDLLESKVPLALWYHEYIAMREPNPPGSLYLSKWEQRFFEAEQKFQTAGCRDADLPGMLAVYGSPDHEVPEEWS